MPVGDELIVERLVAHLREGTTDAAESDLRLPAWHYFDPDHAALERAMFLGRPLLAAVSSALPAPGAFLTMELVGVPLLLVRQEDGSLAGFRNVCRHRGGRVEQQVCGSRRLFTCRYHGWTYERDGSLRHVPYGEGFPSVDPACHGLVPVATAERHGLVWVQLGAMGGLDTASYFGSEFDEQLGQVAPEGWEVYIEESFTQPINWKLIADGLLDILHPKFLHPDSVGRLIQTHTHTWDRYGHHGRLAMARRKLDKIKDDVPAGTDLRRYVITNFFVYPNTMLVLQPDHIELWTVFPDAESPERSTTYIRFLVPAQPQTDDARALLDQQWEILTEAVTGEDWPMAESIQRAVKSTRTPFIYGTNELPAQHLHRRLAEDIEALAAACD